MQYIHISDTIQTSDTLSKHDTTVSRLTLWYKILIQHLGIEKEGDNQDVFFLGSEFGNSFQTGAQAIAILKKRSYQTTQVILINNASRAKHQESSQAKGSDCLWAQVQIQGVTHHIIGVDDEAFSILTPYLIPGTKIQKITSIHYTHSDTSIHIDDISQGTQFRSKEHFPLVQLIFQKLLLENSGNIPSQQQLDTIFGFDVFSPYPEEYVLQKMQRVPKVQESSFSDVVEGYIQDVLTQIDTIVEQGGVIQNYSKAYLDGFEGIERVQLVGELLLLREKFGIYTEDSVRDIGVSDKELVTYFEARKNLAINQLILIDRDKFGNGIFSYALGINGIHAFCLKNHFSILTSKEDTEKAKVVKVVGGGTSFSVFPTQSISNLRGENCLWESSSRGPSGEKFLNINTSAGEDHTVLEDIQSFPIGTVLTVYAI